MDDIKHFTELLSKRFPTAEALRKEFSPIEHLLPGYFDNDPFNVYQQDKGLVISRYLWFGKCTPPILGLPKDPTVGVITAGRYNFPTGNNTETMIVLEGELHAGISLPEDPHFYDSKLSKYGSIIAPAGTTLQLHAKSPVFYLCMYKPKRQFL